MKNIKLSSGNLIPIIGMGAYFDPEIRCNTEKIINCALECGYRHIDTARGYDNERGVGDALKKSGVKRDELFITTKLANEDIRKRRTRDAFYESLNDLQLDYIDLYLIHWPTDGYEEAWTEMEKLYEEGLIKNIGVSNFHKQHFDAVLPNAKIIPVLNQIESNPGITNVPLIEYCKGLGIEVEAWSPLGGGACAKEILSCEALTKIGDKYGKNPAQVIVRWNIQRDVIVLPKSSNEARIAQNIDVFDFELTENEIQMINALNKNTRSGPDPDNFNF